MNTERIVCENFADVKKKYKAASILYDTNKISLYAQGIWQYKHFDIFLNTLKAEILRLQGNKALLHDIDGRDLFCSPVESNKTPFLIVIFKD